MEELKRLARIVTLFGNNKIKLFDPARNKEESKEEKLFLNIVGNKYSTDKDAVLDIYGSTSRANRYRMLKSRLRQRLYAQLFFVENASRPAKREEKKCLDLSYKGKILLQVTEYPIAKQLFNKALQTAMPFEFTDIVIDCLSNLNFIHTQQQDFSGFTKTLVKLKWYRNLKEKEEKAYEIYYQCKLTLLKSVAARKNHLNRVPSVISELRLLWKTTDSFNIYFYYYMLNGMYLELIGDFDNRILDIQESEKLLIAGRINPYRFDSLLNKYLIIYALFRAKKYEKGLALASQYLPDFNPYSRNWFAYMEEYFLLAMHANKFNLAVDLIVEVDQNIYFKRLKKKNQESWALYKAYLYFLNPKKSVVTNFNYQKFISSVPEHSKDKLGHNIALHILQFLYHLKNSDYDQLYYKEGAFRKYVGAYLKDQDSQRSRIFFRLLIIVIRTDFNKDKSLRKAQKWIEKLRTTPEPGDAHARVEILPYEKLWETVLSLLVDNRS